MKKIVLGFAISLSFHSGLLAQEDSIQYGLFDHDSALYFDVGEGSQRFLSVPEREELEVLLEARIRNLQETLATPTLFESAVEAREAELKSIRRFESWLFGVVGAGAGVVGSLATLDYLMGGLGPLLNSVPTRFGFTIIGLSFAKVGASLGVALAQARHQPEGIKREIDYLDLRSREIIKAAQDVSARMRAMAVPLSFWSTRRFSDFVETYVAFFALERILINDQHGLTAQMNDALERSGQSHILKNKEVQMDAVDAQLTKQRLAGVRKLRQLELETLRLMKTNLNGLGEARVLA